MQRYAPELEQQLRRSLKPTNKSWRVDETYVRVNGRVGTFHVCNGQPRSILRGQTLSEAAPMLREPPVMSAVFPSSFLDIVFIALRQNPTGPTLLDFADVRSESPKPPRPPTTA